MRARSFLTTLVCLVAVAAFPATGIAQTAGQVEYGGVAAAQETAPPAATPPAVGVAAETAESTPAEPAPSGPSAAVAAETSDGTLPFTGRDLLLMLVAGIGLVGLGVGLRSVTRAPAGA